MVARHDIRAVMARTPTANRINHAGLVKEKKMGDDAWERGAYSHPRIPPFTFEATIIYVDNWWQYFNR